MLRLDGDTIFNETVHYSKDHLSILWSAGKKMRHAIVRPSGAVHR
jgi:hypothetical protein